MIRLTPRAAGALFALVLAASGCSDSGSADGSDGSAGSSGATGTAACLEKAVECLGNQMVCVERHGATSCEACPEGEFAGDGTACTPIPGQQLSNVFGVLELDPGDEISSLCQSWTVGNTEELWVNGVELLSDGAYHHSNWLFVPDDVYDGPDGAWPCRDRNYSELEAAIAGGVLFAQSTQATKEVQRFPDGVAIRLPPRARIIGGTHLLNTTPDMVTTSLEMNIYTVPKAEVTVPLAPFRLTYSDLAIAPQAETRFTGECDFDEQHQMALGTPLAMDLYWVLPHFHELGSLFRLEVFGGPNDGQEIFQVEGFNAEARGRGFNPPIDMSGANGFRFTCGFTNPRSAEVGWGIGDQEMCVMLGFARSDLLYDANVEADSQQTGTTEGAGQFSGPCRMLAVPAPATE